jgi:hypothetical protein
MAGWTAADIPDQSGRSAVVTGSNSGLGLVAGRGGGGPRPRAPRLLGGAGGARYGQRL